ncbi:MAG: hypothetical protein J3R72DRAFT_426337 [Linnemannia gamsii]|nr:MAG: hypothetical protein J3R72DRAFT_426337 [Linnemannia gamsii]
MSGMPRGSPMILVASANGGRKCKVESSTMLRTLSLKPSQRRTDGVTEIEWTVRITLSRALEEDLSLVVKSIDRNDRVMIVVEDGSTPEGEVVRNKVVKVRTLLSLVELLEVADCLG